MRKQLRHRFLIIILTSLIGVGVAPLPVASQADNDPYDLISQDSIFAFLEDLTAIQPYSGWRNSATEGEAEALDYVADTLDGFAYLRDLGLELERQTFHVFLATEIWETRLVLATNGQEIEVPADAQRGHRHNIVQALRFDSDGALNDSERNPVEVEGEVIVIRSADDLAALTGDDAQDKIIFLAYEVVDRQMSREAMQRATTLIEKEPAGLILVAQFSSAEGESRGNYLGDGFVFDSVMAENVVPTLYVRLEDLAPAGITNWDDLAQIEAAHLVWDTDVFSPGTSGNMVARIPGLDSSQAMILGAHIDSANSPGAMDNGVNSAVLLEVARVLNEAQIQPAVDVVLVWFGSEEIGLYGSQVFVNTHQALLDRTMAAYLMDGIIMDLPGDFHEVLGWSHQQFGDRTLPFSDYIIDVAAERNITIDHREDFQGIPSDNGVFSGFVPQIGYAFGSAYGGAGHSPYDSFEEARQLDGLVEEVAALALIAALETGQDAPELRVTPASEHRALIIASHTEVVYMTPSTLIDLDRALAWAGFDVDVIPYGQTVTADDLTDADLVVALPLIDYVTSDGDLMAYDEAWGDAEVEALVTYVEQGGLLVLTNSANRLNFWGPFEANEDWQDANALSAHFGVVYQAGPLPASGIRTQYDHPIMDMQYGLVMARSNSVPFTMETGEMLAQIDDVPVIGLIDYGEAGGQVLVMADVGILGFVGFVPTEGSNYSFLRNLAQYALEN